LTELLNSERGFGIGQNRVFLPVQSWPVAIVQTPPMEEEAITFAAFFLELALFIT
jgi:hypothetical protein